MSTWLLVPPIAFVILLALGWVLSVFSRKLAFKNPYNPAGREKAYACGEDVPCERVQPDYSQFFPFAFFFTIMHVVALIVATVPDGGLRFYGIAFLYVAAAFAALLILFRREEKEPGRVPMKLGEQK